MSSKTAAILAFLTLGLSSPAFADFGLSPGDIVRYDDRQSATFGSCFQVSQAQPNSTWGVSCSSEGVDPWGGGAGPWRSGSGVYKVKAMGDGSCQAYGFPGSPVACPDSCNESYEGNACPPPPSETCTDGIQNQGETGVDCGGPCAACPPQEPAHCSDGSRNEDETGIDCGGSCSAVCEEICPPPAKWVGLSDPDGSGEETVCIHSTGTDGYGNCPPGWYPAEVTASEDNPAMVGKVVCTSVVDTVQAANPESVDEVQTPTGFAPGTFNVVESTSAPTVTNHADGTSTVTSTKTTTTTGANGETISSTSTTSTHYSGANGTGSVTGTDVETTGSTGFEDNPENYGTPGLGSNNTYDSALGEGEQPAKKEISDLLSDFAGSSPLAGMLGSMEIQAGGALCSVEIEGGINDQPAAIDLCRWESYLRAVGLVALVIVNGAAVLVVIRGWKASTLDNGE